MWEYSIEMKTKSMMDIALANDEYYFTGLWSTLMSLLASTPDASNLRIHVIDTGIEDASWERLSIAVAKHPSPPTLLRKVFPPDELDKIRVPGQRYPITKLFLPELLDCDRVLYLDSDLLIFRDVSELQAIDLAGHACAAVINEDAGTLDFDLTQKQFQRLNLDPKSNYFNAGLLYMNLAYWRFNDLTNRCLNYMKAHTYRLAEQSAINAVMNDEILPLDKNWNRLANFLTPAEVASPCFIIHYTSHKPWLLHSDSPVMILWRKFTHDTKFSIEPPQDKQSVFDRFTSLIFLRGFAYGLAAVYYACLQKKSEADGYAYAFTYWMMYFSDRENRARDHAIARAKILNTPYAPKWLSGSEEGSITTTPAPGLSTIGKSFIKGERLSVLLRDRGRSRNFIAKSIQGRKEAQLKAFVDGEKQLRVASAKSDIAISMTSWAPRAKTLPLVLLSILEQKLAPPIVYVWLAPEDEVMIKAEHKEFFEGHGVEFHVTEDIIPHKKWLPVLELGRKEPFVIIDDDTYYPKDWFSSLVAEAVQYPENILAHRCHRISVDNDHQLLPYDQWQKDVRYDGKASNYIFPTGCGGVMIQPDAIGEDFRRRDLIDKLCPIADDVWLKAAYLQSGFKCRKSHYSFPCLDYPGTQESGLAVKNVDQGANDQQLKDVFDYFDLKLD